MNLWEERPNLKLCVLSKRNELPWGRENWHAHPFYEMGLVLQGEGDWLFGERQRVAMKAREVILLGPEVPHCEFIHEGKFLSAAWIGFDCEGDAPQWVGKSIPMEDDFEELKRIFETVYEEQRGDSLFSRLRLNLLVQTAILLVSRRAETRNEKEQREVTSPLSPRQIRCVEAAAYYLRENLEAPLRIAQVAGYYSMCPAYFSTLFQKHFGVPPQAFLIEARIERAAELLEGTSLTVKEIAARCGYSDAAHFCKEFKAKRGMPPGEFRGGPVHPKRRTP